MSVGGHFKFEWQIRNKETNVFEHYIDEQPNAVVVQGLNWLLNVSVGSFAGSGARNCFVGLKNAGAVDSSDTYASHAGWTEFTAAADRQVYYCGGASAGQITNTGSVAVFAITSAGTVAGALLVNSWGSCFLIAASNINSARTIDSGDTINVTYTLTASNQ